MIGDPVRVRLNKPLRARLEPERFTARAEIVKENRRTIWVRLAGGRIIQRRRRRDVAGGGS
jgi:hypothetical protein